MKRSLLVLAIIALTTTASAVTVTRGPYLQTPTPASIIVRWRTDSATSSRVQYGATPGSLTQTVDDATPTTEHIVSVTALSADTRYYYAVGSVGGALVGDDADHYFRTPPVPGPARPTRIWVTGDGGFANANGMAVRDSFATYNAGNETDLWLLLGDNAYLSGTDTEFQAALFDMHHDMLLRVPAWPTFGNHEALSSNTLTETGPYFAMFSLPRAGEAGGVPSGTEAYYAFDFANVHFIVLDSHFSLNTAGSPMMLWLEADLQATTADWVIAYWHHPPYSKGLFHDSDVEQREIDMRGNVLPLLEIYGVDLVLCGHSHNYERSHLLDGHYGLSPTLTPAMVLDSGDGNPSSEGAYRKATVGLAPNEGAVYVVAGSSSEVRNATLNHPAMEIGLLQLGSLILDVDGNALRGTFLNSLVQTTDTFTLIKGPACGTAPKSGCTASPKGRLIVRDKTPDALDKASWRWTGGSVNVGQVGTPTAQTDLAFCVYDGTGALVGGAVPHSGDAAGAGRWVVPNGGGFRYRDAAAGAAGIEEIRIKPGAKSPIRVKGKGAALGVPTLPVTAPLTAQLVNLDNGACWETVFPVTKKNDPSRVVASLP